MTQQTIINAKFYQRHFGVTYKTALAWLNEDLENLNRERITLEQFIMIYQTLQPIVVVRNDLKKVKKGKKK